MMAMTTNYPIRARRETLVKYEVPPEFIGGSDSRVQGYAQCKIDAIDWWIERSRLPNDEVRQVIDVLAAKPRKEVEDYLKINWRGTTILKGYSNLERKAVATQRPIVKIPRHYRTPDQEPLQPVTSSNTPINSDPFPLLSDYDFDYLVNYMVNDSTI